MRINLIQPSPVIYQWKKKKKTTVSTPAPPRGTLRSMGTPKQLDPSTYLPTYFGTHLPAYYQNIPSPIYASEAQILHSKSSYIYPYTDRYTTS